jgi:hypothetical protein
MTPLRILFIRAVPQPVALQALRRIRNSHPSAHIAVLASESSITLFRKEGIADEYFAYQAARFGIAAAGAGLVLRLRRLDFDFVIAPYIGVDRLAFWNVARVALVLTRKKAVWLSCDSLHHFEEAEKCPSISFGERWRHARSMQGMREAILRLLKVPFLCLFYLAAMLSMAMLATVLIPLVWLKPAHREDGNAA